MGFFKRLCLFIFSLCGLVTLAVLCLVWVGPWTQELRTIFGMDAYFSALEIGVALTAAGLLITLLRSLFVRNRKVIVVSKIDGDQISIARDAVASQARHIIQDDGRFVCKQAKVKAKKHGHVRLFARIEPLYTVDIPAASQELHDALMVGLKTVVGNNVDAVVLEFVDAQEHGEPYEEQQHQQVAAVGTAGVAAGAGQLGSTAAVGQTNLYDTSAHESKSSQKSGTPIKFETGLGKADHKDDAHTEPSDTSEITVPMTKYTSQSDNTSGAASTEGRE